MEIILQCFFLRGENSNNYYPPSGLFAKLINNLWFILLRDQRSRMVCFISGIPAITTRSGMTRSGEREVVTVMVALAPIVTDEVVNWWSGAEGSVTLPVWSGFSDEGSANQSSILTG